MSDPHIESVRAKLAETCCMCGKDCDFLRFCDGMCVPCADRIQAAVAESSYLPQLINGFAAACMRVAELEPGGWIPVGERLPEERLLVLGCAHDMIRVVSLHGGCFRQTPGDWPMKPQPKFWQALPAPPKG